ncbi:MAG: HlyC/CorC family transporter [Deltaproteobacteria bacterium]|nr:HlyC/CorC family transporter [Deltaproteobacteria bacterium]
MTIPIVIIIVCILVQGFFSGSEIAMVSADKMLLNHRAQTGSRAAKLVLTLLDSPQRLLSTTVLGTDIASVAATSLATLIFIEYAPRDVELLTIAVMSPTILLFGEVIPKSIFQQGANKIVLKIVYPIKFFYVIFSPITGIFTRTIAWVLGRFGVEPHGRRNLVTREELKLLLRISDMKNAVAPDERRMIDRIFRFAETKASDVMVPLVEVVALPDHASMSEAARLIAERGYSRVPVFQDRVVNLNRVVRAFDLLSPKPGSKTVGDIAHAVRIIPESRRIDELLLDLQRSGEGLAVVVDEFGGAVGIVTLDDIVSQIVGEIEDGYDRRRPTIRKVELNRFIASGQLDIAHANQVMRISLPEGDYATLAGFVLDRLRRFPTAGESIHAGDVVITVQKVSERRIEEVLVEIRVKA